MREALFEGLLFSLDAAYQLKDGKVDIVERNPAPAGHH